MLLARVADFSDTVFVNFYRAQAETVMRTIPAKQIKEWRDNGELEQV